MKPNGLILWEGASSLDGAPIVVIATGLGRRSSNQKTGGMVQTYILRADVSPVGAVKSGEDASICGDCPHRGDGTGKGRTCYVNVGQGALSVWRAYKRGSYPRAARGPAWDIFNGRAIRFGTYGDPAAAPFELWDSLKARAARTTGYTHQWRDISPAWARLLMASADTAADVGAAREMGWRTFRATLPGESPLTEEVLCPASKEAGAKLQCEQCGACGGADGRRGSIYIPLHGSFAVVANAQKLEARLIARG